MSYSHEYDHTVIDEKNGRIVADFRQSDSERTYEADHLDGIRRGLAGFAAGMSSLLRRIADRQR